MAATWVRLAGAGVGIVAVGAAIAVPLHMLGVPQWAAEGVALLFLAYPIDRLAAAIVRAQSRRR